MRTRVGRDVAVIVLVHLALASAIGLLLPFVVDLPDALRTADGVNTTEVELGKQFNDDGWLIVTGGVVGLIAGLVLQAWRRTQEVVTLVAITVSALLAALLAGWIAQATGPADPVNVLADADVGTRAAMQLHVEARVAYVVWPLTAVVGALVALLAPPTPSSPPQETSAPPEGTTAQSAASKQQN